MSIIAFLLVGLIAGFLSGKIVDGHGFGAMGDIAVGIVGAFIGGELFTQFASPSSGFAVTVLMATLGAVVLLLAVNLVSSLLGHSPHRV